MLNKMTQFKIIFGCLVLMGSLLSCDDPEGGLHLKYKKKVLSNGLTLVLVEDHTSPLVSYQTWYRVGSVDERPGFTGISHLFEYLMFRGTNRFPSRKFFQELESKGAEVSASVSRDSSVFYEVFSSDLLDRVIDMESDRMENQVFTEEILNYERMISFEERRLRSENSQDSKVQEAIWQLAYRRHPYQWPVMGYPQDLLQVTTPMLEQYYKLYFQPANATLVLVGDFQTDETIQKLKNYYEKIPSRPQPTRDIPEEPAQQEERRLVLRDSAAPTEKFVHAYHIPAAGHKDVYALDVLANLLFEGKQSRAYQELVEKQGLLSSISGSAYTPAFPGLFLIQGILKSKTQTVQAEAALDRLIEKVQEKGVTSDEVTRSIKQLTIQLLENIKTPFGLGQLIGTVQTIFGDPGRVYGDFLNYPKVTKDDVKKVARKYFEPNGRSVVNLRAKEPEL